MIEERMRRKNPEREGEAAFMQKTKSISLRSRVVLDGYVRPAQKIDRATARKLGEKLYWPDKPCARRGHEYWRLTESGKCLACYHLHAASRYAMPLSRGRKWDQDEQRRKRTSQSHGLNPSSEPDKNPPQPLRMAMKIQARHEAIISHADIGQTPPSGATHAMIDPVTFLKKAKSGAYKWSSESSMWVYIDDGVARMLLRKAAKIISKDEP